MTVPDPGDDPIARLALLEQLDLPETLDYGRVFDPTYRTIHGRSLNADEAHLLLSCTIEDLHTLADVVDERTARLHAYGSVLADLAATTRALTAIAQPFARGDGIEQAVIRMPADKRRQVRRLQNKIDELKRTLGDYSDVAAGT